MISRLGCARLRVLASTYLRSPPVYLRASPLTPLQRGELGVRVVARAGVDLSSVSASVFDCKLAHRICLGGRGSARGWVWHPLAHTWQRPVAPAAAETASGSVAGASCGSCSRKNNVCFCSRNYVQVAVPEASYDSCSSRNSVRECCRSVLWFL